MKPLVTFLHPGWLLIGCLAAAWTIWLERAAGGSPRRRLWRAALAGATALALAGPQLPARSAAETVLLIDASASVDELARKEALRTIDPESRLGRLAFGDATASPIGWALDRAAGLATGGRLLLLSDGQWTDPAVAAGPAPWRDPRLAAANARTAGLRVDVVPLTARKLPGAMLVAMDHVDRLREGDPLTLSLLIDSERSGSAELSLWSTERRLAGKTVDLVAGRQTVILALGGLPVGSWPLEARLRSGGSVGAESRLQRGVVVVPPPAVLVVGEGEAAGPLARALSSAGMTTAAGSWTDLSSRLSGLAEWDALVLVDAPAARLGMDQIAALEVHVRERGAGLLLTAGPNSFDAGEWSDTVLERLSPLSLAVPPRRHRDPLSLTLLVDRSASMGSVEGRGRTAKIDLARDALLLAVEALDPGDRVGVVAFDEVADWLLAPAVLGEARERSEIEAILAGLTTAGGTGIGAALDLALPAVGAQTGVTARHILLVSDGQDFSADLDRLEGSVNSARRSGVTLSTIAVGKEADVALLARLAAAGGGRFHAAIEPADLPALALAESRIIRSRSEQRGSFRANPPPGPWQPLLAGVDVAALPPLAAYRALRSRTGLHPALQSSGGDPLLVSWPWGLGQVAAWASGIDDDWAPGWLASEAGQGLLSSVVRQIARPPDAAPPLVFVRDQGDSLRLGFMADQALAAAPITVSLPAAKDGSRSQSLVQVSAGRHEAAVAVPPGEVWPAVLHPGGGAPPIDLMLAAPRSQELTPGATADGDLLAEVAAAGGGRILTADEARATLRTVHPPRWPLPNLVLALLALLWMAEVAWQLRGSRSGRRALRQEAAHSATPSTGDHL